MEKFIQAVFGGADTPMRKIFTSLLAVIFLLSLCGCISFKVNPLPFPENFLVRAAVCKKIDDSGELLEPQEIMSEFDEEGQNIFCFIELANVSREITLQWKWYSPDKKLIRESSEVPVNQEIKYLESVTAYDKLSPDQGTTAKGEWTVIVLVNGKLAVRLTFSVVRCPLNSLAM